MPRAPKGLVKRGPSYYVRVYRGNQQKWVNVGRNESEARRAYHRIRGAQSVDAIPEASAKRPTVCTVAEAADAWLEVYCRKYRNEYNQKITEARVRRFIKPGLGEL